MLKKLAMAKEEEEITHRVITVRVTVELHTHLKVCAEAQDISLNRLCVVLLNNGSLELEKPTHAQGN